MGYGAPPWVFRGRALYQLQLVKTEEAKKHIPEGFNIVSLFGYTLGGFYLARYADSPTGAFDELVALAGLAWNPPTSCAWAARVYVSSPPARAHGRAAVGLPSCLASFADSGESRRRGWLSHRNHHQLGWWRQPHAGRHQRPSQGAGAADSSHEPQQLGPGHTIVLRNEDLRHGRRWGSSHGAASSAPEVCRMALPPARRGWAGPRIRMSLPSFSGGTPDCPGLLKYSCLLHTNVRPVPPARVILPAGDAQLNQRGENMAQVLGGWPLLALAFDNMEMTVHQPTRLRLGAKDDQAAEEAQAHRVKHRLAHALRWW